MAAIAQTIAIVDKSGKVVSTSKQLRNVFKEAKLAYQERKAEIISERKAKEDRELQKAIKAMSIADSESRSERPRHHRSRSGRERERAPGPELRVRPPTERHQSRSSARSGHSSVVSSPRSPRSGSGTPRSPSHHSPVYRSPTYDDEEDLPPAYTRPKIPESYTGPRRSLELVRARTDLDVAQLPQRPQHSSRANSTSAIDMDLAYGEYHPHFDPESPIAIRNREVVEKQELSSLVLKCKMLLDEANCAQHSVKAIVSHLQKNPDAMAAVALTLAEISNIASKMAPGALTVFKAGAPSVFALLAAPEFLIAVGVSVGITIVMFGGYKIIKKIRTLNKEKEGGVDEMIDVDELSHIESWRRGIADTAYTEDTQSVVSGGTSVEGEFITPVAARSLGHLPPPKESRKNKGKEKEKKKEKEKERKKSASKAAGSVSSKGTSGSRLRPGDADKRAVVKVKKPSPLRRMFNRDDRSSVAS